MQDKFEKNIKSQLENHEINAPDNAWENISAALGKKKPKFKPWLKRMGILVAVLIPALTITGLWYFNADRNQVQKQFDSNVEQQSIGKLNHNLNDTQKPDNATSSTNELNLEKMNDIENDLNSHDNKSNANRTDYSPFSEGTYTQSKSANNQNLISNDASNALVSMNKNDLDQTSDAKNETSNNSYVNPLMIWKSNVFDLSSNAKIDFNAPELYAFHEPNQKLKREEELLKTIEEKESPKERNVVNLKRNEIVFTPYYGVAYMGSLNEASWISPEFNQLDIENKMANSFGARAAYNINERLKLRTGLGVMDLKQTTLDVPLVVDPENGSIAYNLRSYNNIGVDLSRYGQVSNYHANAEFEGSKRLNEDISHELQFIEVPLEVEYLLTENQKLNFMATGGMSTMFLNKNEVYLESQLSAFAKSTNMKSVSFSANAGMKMEYGFTDKVSMNLEPQVRYMINTVTANSDFQPYLLILNAGFSLSF